MSGYRSRMWQAGGTWIEAGQRAGFEPEGPIPSGLRFRRKTRSAVASLEVAGWQSVPSVRLVVEPCLTGPSCLILPASDCPLEPEARTGDAMFDGHVVIARGAQELMPRLEPALRQLLTWVVGSLGATVGPVVTLEPVRTARIAQVDEAVDAIERLTEVAVQLAEPLSVERALPRWWRAEGAPAVERALAAFIDERLGSLAPESTAAACAVLVDRGLGPLTPRLAAMPFTHAVLQTWLQHGRPHDERLQAAVRQAARAGDAELAAAYLGWLVPRGEADAVSAHLLAALWEELAAYPGIADAVALALPESPPLSARPMLVTAWPRTAQAAARMARQLCAFRHPEADSRLLGWLGAAPELARAAANALAQRVSTELESGSTDVLGPIAAAARSSTVLVQALVRSVPRSGTGWLGRLRPRGETAALELIRRLGAGGADVDDALLYWLDGGTPAVQLAAVSALATAGTGRVIRPLRERAGGWFGDSVVRAHCRAAAQAVRDRVGASGALAIAEMREGALSLADDDG